MGKSALVLLFVYIAVCSLDVGWDYGEKAYTRCKAKGRVVPKGACESFQEVIEDYFDNMGAQLDQAWSMPRYTASAQAKKRAHIDAGLRIIDQTIEWIITTKTSSKESINKEFMGKFFKWYANVLKDEPEITLPPNMDISQLPEFMKKQQGDGNNKKEL